MEGSESRSLCRSLVIRVSGMSGGNGDVWLLFGIPEMRVFWSESRLLRCPSGETLPCFYAGSTCFYAVSIRVAFTGGRRVFALWALALTFCLFVRVAREAGEAWKQE